MVLRTCSLFMELWHAKRCVQFAVDLLLLHQRGWKMRMHQSTVQLLLYLNFICNLCHRRQSQQIERCRNFTLHCILQWHAFFTSLTPSHFVVVNYSTVQSILYPLIIRSKSVTMSCCVVAVREQCFIVQCKTQNKTRDEGKSETWQPFVERDEYSIGGRRSVDQSRAPITALWSVSYVNVCLGDDFILLLLIFTRDSRESQFKDLWAV